jgi:hypothetical protein
MIAKIVLFALFSFLRVSCTIPESQGGSSAASGGSIEVKNNNEDTKDKDNVILSLEYLFSLPKDTEKDAGFEVWLCKKKDGDKDGWEEIRQIGEKKTYSGDEKDLEFKDQKAKLEGGKKLDGDKKMTYALMLKVIPKTGDARKYYSNPMEFGTDYSEAKVTKKEKSMCGASEIISMTFCTVLGLLFFYF